MEANRDFFGTFFALWSHLGRSPKFGTLSERLPKDLRPPLLIPCQTQHSLFSIQMFFFLGIFICSMPTLALTFEIQKSVADSVIQYTHTHTHSHSLTHSLTHSYIQMSLFTNGMLSHVNTIHVVLFICTSSDT